MEPVLNKKNIVEYINIDSFDIEYLIDNIIFDPNKFQPILEEKNEKGKKEAKNESKAKKSGKKKKGIEEEDLNLSKQSSKLSIYSIKPGKAAKGKPHGTGKNVIAQKAFNVNVIIDKSKALAVSEVQKVQKHGDKKKILPEEEIIDTSKIKLLKEEIDESRVPKSEEIARERVKPGNKGKKSKKEKEPKEKEPKEKEPKEKETIEGKPTSTQSKRVDDFLKSVKEKKQVTKNPKIEQKESVKVAFLSHHKYLFIVDPAQRLRLRELCTISGDVIEFLFELIKGEFPRSCNKQLDEMMVNNIKESAILIDNMCEICHGGNYLDLAILIIENTLDHALKVLSNPDMNAMSIAPVRSYMLNILYIVNKYHIESNFSLITKKMISLYQSLREVSIEKLRTYLTTAMKDRTVLKLKDDEELGTYLLFKAMLSILIETSDNSKSLSLCDIMLDENINTLMSIIQKYLDKKTPTGKNTDFIDYESFFNDYENLKFFTKFSHLFDCHKSKLSVLSLKISRVIESNLVDIQNGIMRSHEQVFSRMINMILLRYIQDFDLLYEVNEIMYDDFFNLIKFICDDKIFSVDSIHSVFSHLDVLKLPDFAFSSDDVMVKYITFIMKYVKYFERIVTQPGYTEHGCKLFLFFFHQVLETIFNMKQGYQKDKYYKLIHREIEPYLNSQIISEQIFNHMTDFIRNSLLPNISSNQLLIKNIKTLKDYSKFYSNYPQIKSQILRIFDTEIKDKIEYSLFSIFYLSFLKLDKQEDRDMLQSLVANSRNFIENILFIDRKFCAFIMKYCIDDEITALDKIIEFIFDELSSSSTLTLSLNFLIDFLTQSLKCNLTSSKHNNIANICIIQSIIENLIKKHLLNGSAIDINLIQEIMKMDIEKHSSTSNDLQYQLIKDSLLLYFSNTILQIEGYDSSTYEQILLRIREYCKMFRNGVELDYVKEVIMINSQTKNMESAEYYLKSLYEILPMMTEMLNLNRVLKMNPNIFQCDDIQIETVHEIQGGIESNEQISGQSDSKTTMEVQPQLPKMSKINLDLILHVLLKYLDIIDSNFNFNAATIHPILFNISQMQESISTVLYNDSVFLNLIHNKNLLELFIKKYISIQDKALNTRTLALKNCRKIETDNSVLENQEEISKYLLINDLCEEILTNTSMFITRRCRDQLVFLFSESEIYNMLLSKDRVFLKIACDRMTETYKATILNEKSIPQVLKKAQDEDEDLLEEAVHSIFGKHVIEYLEYPQEIIEFLKNMNDALNYDFKANRKMFYNTIFPYFYIWKTIMSKIENGFKLYTTDKAYVKVIDDYKTMLKFIVNYLERNTKLYEMFLLLIVSLIHLIEEEKEKSDDDKTGSMSLLSSQFELFDDTNLTDSFDHNTLQFLLYILFKFVKIFPSLVKFYFDESKTKLKIVFKNLISSVILPKLLNDLRERISSNSALLLKNRFKLKDTHSSYFLEFEYSANDEIKFFIEIKIPPIFPLKKLDINIKCNAVIDDRKMLNIKMNLNHTLNSSIDNINDNLIMWSEDVKQLIIMGCDSCPICYFYLHTTDKSLPGLYCRVCRKKFHSLCIKEWFKNLTQNGQKTSCPMCRSEWKMK